MASDPSVEDQPRYVTTGYGRDVVDSLENVFSGQSRLSFVQYSFENSEQLERTVDSVESWRQLVDTIHSKHAEHFCFIQKKHSWSRLIITHELFFQLMSCYSVNPSLLLLAKLFGSRTAESSSYSKFFFRRKEASLAAPIGGFELHYTIRYVEKNGRHLTNPWSIRQMGVYHQVNFARLFSCWIIIHGPKSLRMELTAQEAKQRSNGGVQKAFRARAASNCLKIVSFAAGSWGPYLDYLASEFKDKVRIAVVASKRVSTKLLLQSVASNGADEMGAKQNDRALICKVVKVTSFEDDDFEIGLRDMQWLQWLMQHLHVVKRNLTENIDAISGLQRYAHEQLFQCGSKEGHERFDNIKLDFLSWLDVWKHELVSKSSDLQVLMGQARECCRLVYNIVNIKDSEIIQQHGKTLNAMTERSREDSQLLLDLTTKAQHTGRSMQTLTLVMLLYLPPSFLATLFGMNFFVVQQAADGTTRFRLIKEFWLFAATSIPLTVLTIAVWYVWDRKKRWACVSNILKS